eukprot:15208717-Heterocapsa_arctica.AAC.1
MDDDLVVSSGSSRCCRLTVACVAGCYKWLQADMSVVLAERRKHLVAEGTGDFVRYLYTKGGSARRLAGAHILHITQVNTNLLNAGADNVAEGALICDRKPM